MDAEAMILILDYKEVDGEEKPILMAFKLADNRSKLQKVGHPEGAFWSWGESREICLYVI